MTNPLATGLGEQTRHSDGAASRAGGGGRGLQGIREGVTVLRGQLSAGADEELVRTGLRAIIEAEADLTVVGEAADGADVTGLMRLRPDVVLMDVRMPAIDGIQATRHILDTVREPPRILVVTTFENDDYVYDALRAGASGFLLKRARPAEIVQAIRVVAHGESLLFPAAVRRLVARHGRGGIPRACGRSG
jgi:DNA-binding NarL/FixJ family response regulator